MDAGSPAPSRPSRRARRWGRRAAGAALGSLLALWLLPPLLARGPVLRWGVARATRDLCGAVSLEGGHVGWMVVPDLLRRRPFPVTLFGVHVAGPDGSEVLRVAHFTAAVDVERDPWRVTVEDGVASDGRWRLVVDPKGGRGGLLGAFQKVPAGATRAACLVPPPPRPSGGSRLPAAPPVTIELRDSRLDEIDVELDFPMWGLSLPRAHAMGSLTLGPTKGGAGFTFDVRDAKAPGGTLRVGRGGAAATAATTTAHFDDVVIAHVGVSRDEPGDLDLTVARADTGRSRLAGTATFDNVFAHHGKRVDRHPPGLVLDARWDRLADAAARLEAPWLPREALAELLDGVLVARVRGPFLALSGTVSLQGARAGIEATVEEGRRATLDARTADLALAPFLHKSLVPLLGGRVTGRLRLRLELLAGLGDVDLQIPSADVTLTRSGGGPAPRRLSFRVGAPAPAPTDETLAFGLTSAGLRRRVLRLEGLYVRWAELSARGALTLELPRGTGGGSEAPARLDAELSASVSSLARWVPPQTASARAAARVTLTGPLDHLRARLTFAPSTSATILGERFRVPGAVTASYDDGRVLAVDGLSLARVGGGRMDARGRAELAGPISGGLRLTHYPLAALPGLESVLVPAALGRGHATSLREALDGTLDADLRVTGVTSRPSLAGTLVLTGLGLAGHHIGDGRVHVRARGWTVAVDGTLGPSLALDLSATRGRAGLSADANLQLRELALAPWLPPAFAGLEVALSGAAHVALAPGRPFATHLELKATGPGGALAVESTTSGQTLQASARGRLELAGLRPLWTRGLAQADGALDVDLATAPGAPLTGTLVVARALSLRPRGWPLAFGVAEGGRLDVDGVRVRVPALTLTAPGVRLTLAGDVRGDLAEPERSTVAFTAAGQLDAATLARQARLSGLAAASGTITVDARATGALGAPDGAVTARLEAVELRPTSAALPALRVGGVVEANLLGVSTRALRVETLGAGLATGAVTVGTAERPARAVLAPGWPPRLARVDVPVAGRGLRVGDARSQLEIGALDLNLLLTGDPRRALVLSGDVGVAHARFEPFGGPKKKAARGPARPWFEALPPWLTVDVTLHGPPDAVVVDVPVLPDVDLGMRCRVAGSARGGTIAGQVSGRGVYSRVMLALFGPKGARECRVLKE